MIHDIHKERTDELANIFYWEFLDYQRNIGMVSYKRNDVRMNIYLTTRTVSTSMDHPTKGKTQLFRRNVTSEQLEQLFKQPRTHTGKGYYKKKKK